MDRFCGRVLTSLVWTCWEKRSLIRRLVFLLQKDAFPLAPQPQEEWGLPTRDGQGRSEVGVGKQGGLRVENTRGVLEGWASAEPCGVGAVGRAV